MFFDETEFDEDGIILQEYNNLHKEMKKDSVVDEVVMSSEAVQGGQEDQAMDGATTTNK